MSVQICSSVTALLVSKKKKKENFTDTLLVKAYHFHGKLSIFISVQENLYAVIELNAN